MRRRMNYGTFSTSLYLHYLQRKQSLRRIGSKSTADSQSFSRSCASGARRGSGMHIKWVKERKAEVQADTVGSQKDMVRSSSPLSVSSRGRGEGRFTNANLSRSASTASTSSDILTRYFPQRYFVLKSLTQVCIPRLSSTRNYLKLTRWQYDLDLSVQKNMWATQRHNEEILDQAYRTSKDVFLIFSVNKSGEFYGYAR